MGGQARLGPDVFHGSFAARGWASKAEEPASSSAAPADGAGGDGEGEQEEESELATLQGLYVEKEEEVRQLVQPPCTEYLPEVTTAGCSAQQLIRKSQRSWVCQRATLPCRAMSSAPQGKLMAVCSRTHARRRVDARSGWRVRGGARWSSV